MQNTGIKLDEIKKKLSRVPGHKLDEVDDFLGFILSRHKGEGKQNIRMQGIWTGKGFEKIDVKKEIKSLRKDLSKSILKKGK
ncbi:MAG: hypothetical protein JRJ86_14075 [Deltaproteobacteria bacterium]|nr:hypothetical protein [Deltaproteobacteria bacterium]MBW2119865.1 hypothetical protein [Deltaproteobacteria bacterium]